MSYPSPQPADSFQYYLDGELNAANLGNLGHNLTYNLDNKSTRSAITRESITLTLTTSI